MSADSAWSTFGNERPERGRALLVLRRGEWHEPRFVAHVGALLNYAGWWLIEWRYATAVEIAGRA